MTNQDLIKKVLNISGFDQKGLAQYIGTSLVSVVRWERGDLDPSTDVIQRLHTLLHEVKSGRNIDLHHINTSRTFASRGNRAKSERQKFIGIIAQSAQPGSSLVTRLRDCSLWGAGKTILPAILSEHSEPSRTVNKAAAEGVSAGKNTYTYDAHTYHTKVPPQGIAQVIQKYLPNGGLILDPFAGSGMTGVAALTTGHDVILNELSPAASFIADRFTSRCDPAALEAAVRTVTDSLASLRHELYTTECRTCSKETELLFTVWSYQVKCSECDKEFVLWDHSCSYGKTVREHKFLREFPCPHCEAHLKKSRLTRTTPIPVLVGYKCCGKVQSEVKPSPKDIELIRKIESGNYASRDFTPECDLPEGVNLSQPKRHGLTSVK